MLVLSRKIHETIWLGDDIQLVVVSVKGDRVRLGIVAPPEIRVDRDEIRRKINEAKPSRVVRKPR